MNTTPHQGAVYWVHFDSATESSIPHPHVVIGCDDNTVTTCALTSNLKRISMPGNVLLDTGEANLLRQSVVEVSKISTLEITQLGDYIGTLDERRMNQILAGMRFVQRSYFRENNSI